MPKANPRTAADLLVACLEAEGCEYVFSVPGEETLDLLESLSRSAERGGPTEIRHITTRHEQGNSGCLTPERGASPHQNRS